MIEHPEPLPFYMYCGACFLSDENGDGWHTDMTVSVRVEGGLLLHKRRNGFESACGKTFREMSLANFEMKR